MYTECRLAANTVVLECSACQIPIATIIKHRGINLHIKLYCNVFGIGNVMPLKVIAVGHTHTETDNSQPQYNSFVTD